MNLFYFTECGDPPTIPNAPVPPTTTYMPGVTYTYTCTIPFVLSPPGGGTVECQPDKTWTANPQCVAPQGGKCIFYLTHFCINHAVFFYSLLYLYLYILHFAEKANHLNKIGIIQVLSDLNIKICGEVR